MAGRPAVRLGDTCSGHACYLPRPNIMGSPNVSVNGLPQHRLGDLWMVHVCGDPHAGVASMGSSSVFVNYLPACRIGDMVSCGSIMAMGSPNVFIGG